MWCTLLYCLTAGSREEQNTVSSSAIKQDYRKIMSFDEGDLGEIYSSKLIFDSFVAHREGYHPLCEIGCGNKTTLISYYLNTNFQFETNWKEKEAKLE